MMGSAAVVKDDVRSWISRLSLSRKGRILEYSDLLYPAEILEIQDPPSSLKMALFDFGGCFLVW